MANFDPFPAAGLDSNRGGHLTDDQRRAFGSMESNARRGRIGFGAICLAIAALVAVAGTRADPATRLLAAVGFAAVGVLAILYGLVAVNSLTRDLGEGRVASLEGAIGRHTEHSHSDRSDTTFYYLDVADEHFMVGRAEFDAAERPGWVRLYFLPRSRKVVNMERLPDRSVPSTINPFAAGAGPQGITGALGMIGQAMFHPNSERTNEIRAEMSALGHQMQAQAAQAAVPPAPGARDPRPLAEAILGTWQMGPATVTFLPDGTVSASGLGAPARTGHWAVEPDGTLRSDATGQAQTGNAWVVGDTLTISDGHQGLQLRRVGGA